MTAAATAPGSFLLLASTTSASRPWASASSASSRACASEGSVSSSSARRVSYSGPPARDEANADVPSIRPASMAAANEAPSRRELQPPNRPRDGALARYGEGRTVIAAATEGSSADAVAGAPRRCRQAASMTALRARFAWAGLGSSRTRTKRSSCRSSSSPARGSSSVIQSSFIGSSPRPGQARRCRARCPAPGGAPRWPGTAGRGRFLPGGPSRSLPPWQTNPRRTAAGSPRAARA